MDWSLLLSSRRIGKAADDPVLPHRSPYEIDADRIIFSSAFRRLQDKMQVHGRSRSDYVRTRLTHSLEASRVGRSLAALVGRTVAARHRPDVPQLAADLGHIVAAAALAHDIGNPPFGHSGETIVAEWFAGSELGRTALAPLPRRVQAELRSVEGNAQGFRVVTRLQGWRPQGGLQLTAAVLGAFAKYPAAARGELAGRQKYGFFTSEAADFAAVAQSCGLTTIGDLAWVRHPLAYLTEAADDICYLVVDVEDGVKMDFLALGDAEALLLPLIPGGRLPEDAGDGVDRRLQCLRSHAIDRLIGEAAQIFLDHEAEILDGRFVGDLLGRSAVAPAIAVIREVSRTRIYRNDRRAELEARARRALEHLLTLQVTAFLDREAGRRSRAEAVLRHFPGALEAPEDREGWLRTVVDYCFGMTDSFALRQDEALPADD